MATREHGTAVTTVWHLGHSSVSGEQAQRLVDAFRTAFAPLVAAQVLPWNAAPHGDPAALPLGDTVAGELVAAGGFCRWRGEADRFTVSIVAEHPADAVDLDRADEVTEEVVPIRWLDGRAPISLQPHEPLHLVTYRRHGSALFHRVAPRRPS